MATRLSNVLCTPTPSLPATWPSSRWIGESVFGKLSNSSGTLVAQACQQVRIPAAAFGDEEVARIKRDAVLAVVKLFVIGDVGGLEVKLAVERPVWAEKLADYILHV